MPRDHGPQIKDDKLYEDLRKEGNSAEKSARIANAKANGSLQHKGRLDSRTKDDLYQEAQKIGIDGRSRMSRDQLERAIRNHK